MKPDETKLLGLHWNKKEDTIAVTFPTNPDTITGAGKLCAEVIVHAVGKNFNLPLFCRE